MFDLNAAPASLFDGLEPQVPDSLLSLIGLFSADDGPGKIDLGVGVYRDENGRTPVMAAVKAAEARLLAGQSTKAYLGPEGDLGFLEALAPLVLGPRPDRATYAVQTPGGTGALRLAAELIAAARPGGRVFLGRPTWPNHRQILSAAGLSIAFYRHFDAAAQRLCFEEMLAALETGQRGDVLLLQGCCHNPTGADPGAAQWDAIAEVVARRGLIPLIDLAYQGFGEGLEADGGAVRRLIEAASEVLVAYSCSKNFGLYRERTGALFAVSGSRPRLELIASNARLLTRCSWSMAPDHGAAAAGMILQDPALAAQWRAELEVMRRRLITIRQALAAAVPSLAPLTAQRGFFAQLPMSPAQVAAMRSRHGVYTTDSGRINLAGLTPAAIPKFARAYADCIEEVCA